MHWFKENVVGLLAALIILGGSYGALYADVSVSSSAIKKQEQQIEKLNDKVDEISNILHLKHNNYDSQLVIIANSTNRLLLALDKIDAVYRDVVTKNAVQSEQINAIKHHIKLEREYKYENQE